MIWALVMSLIINIWLAVIYFREKRERRYMTAGRDHWLDRYRLEREHSAGILRERQQAIQSCSAMKDELVKLSNKYLELKDAIRKKADEAKKPAKKSKRATK